MLVTVDAVSSGRQVGLEGVVVGYGCPDMSADRRSRLGAPLLAVLMLSLGLLALASAPAAQTGCRHVRDAVAGIVTSLPDVTTTQAGSAAALAEPAVVVEGQPLVPQPPVALVCAALVILAGTAAVRAVAARSGRAGPGPPSNPAVPAFPLRKLVPDPIVLGLLRV